MKHLDEELLAQWALEGTEPEPDAADHLATCATCQAALSDLRALTSELHETPELSTPSAEVWSRISADLDLTPGLDGVLSGTTAEPVVGARPGPRYGRGMLALAAGVAAILGIGIGLGAASVVDRDEQSPAPPPVAVVRLEPLPGQTGSGTADLIQAGNELQVSVDGLDAHSGYYELWLINADGQRMVSLGVLDPATGGTFRIPDNLTSEGYRIIDVSLEPNDGNPAHSRDSIVRGTIPS
ncbi:anti-sigma factor domain-containing protein [Kribbella sp. NBC_00889]|uniref:anti-sigma factor domain-containing protein n=1 Tax=Kribbella sp. NBC_00889 TaxID=2975974 RepID=UPI00386816CC|nr:anti-sigma factor [Kribbella sp. NBC_00889]